MQGEARARLRATWILALLLIGGAGVQAQTPVIVPVGSVPRGVAIVATDSGNFAWVTNFGDNSVSVVNLTTERLRATIGSIPTPAGIAINPLSGLAAVANQFNNSVTVLEVATGRVRGVIPVGSSPIGVAVHPTSNLAVVANSASSSLSIVDLATLRVLAEVGGIPNATGVQAVAIDADLNVAAVVSSTSNSLFVVDLSSRRIRTQIPVESSPSAVAIDPVTKTAVVTNQNSNSISLVDLRSNRASALSGIPQPQAVAIAAAVQVALVTTGANGTLQVVNLATRALQSSILNLPGAAAVAFSESSGRAVVALPSNNALGIIRSFGFSLVASVNAASFQSRAVAASSIAAGFGSNLATETAQATSVPLPVTLGNTSVRVGGLAAPLFYVSRTQINFQVPAVSLGTHQVEILRGTLRVASGILTVATAGPALFTVNQQGTGQAAALNEDNRINGVAPATPSATPNLDPRPAAPGSVIQLFGTGGGATDPQPDPGSAASGAAPTLLIPTATIGGLAATVLYSGASPGLVGVWQVNLRIPASVTRGSSVPVTVTIGTQSTNTVTIAVQ